MSSIKDIMDVDVDPLESQAMRSRQAAQQYGTYEQSSPSPAQAPSQNVEESTDVPRRRSPRLSKANPRPLASKPSRARRQSSGTGESLESFESDGQSSRGSQMADMPSSSRQPLGPSDVRYTPVTGRVSRAKKGYPVHPCEVCDKVFTRAEHLRRHQLGHQKPTYACDHEGCDKAFHRRDLLARHILRRHESQGETSPRAGDKRSRSPSSSPDIQQPHFQDQVRAATDTSTNVPTSSGPGYSASQAYTGGIGPSTANPYDPTDDLGRTDYAQQFNQKRLTRCQRNNLQPAAVGFDSNFSIMPSTPIRLHENRRRKSRRLNNASSPVDNPSLTVQVSTPQGLTYVSDPLCSSEVYTSESTPWSTPSEVTGATRTGVPPFYMATSAEANSQAIAWSPLQYMATLPQNSGSVALDSVTAGYESAIDYATTYDPFPQVVSEEFKYPDSPTVRNHGWTRLS